jgi:hypothetical protein
MFVITAHLKYLWYVVRHKWFVFVEACKLGIPWRGLVHDLSKLRPGEWIPYTRYFYGPTYPSIHEYHGDNRLHASLAGCYKEKVEADFDRAWLLHQHRNPHHWQFWVLREDDGGTRILPMPYIHRCEMLADWRGAGKALGKPDTLAWYTANKGNMLLHPDTREWVERELGA